MYDYDHGPDFGLQTFWTTVLGWTDPSTFKIYHLVIHQAIEISYFDHHLLCPMQYRVNDMAVHDCSRVLTKNMNPETYAVVFLVYDHPEN